ncbi:hypothetical protein EVJ58_g811 [Rhodofomes roseus]|uniref:Nucleoside diphosphate kinase n=1 Tax=Rhodofomes roseus TaxID=34475 RepID=A0A4Y9Z2A5_9APHY|nr:hypothetical protein EVJ58_g811 [Rhodofomes roseus]
MAVAALPQVTPPTYHRIVSPTLQVPADEKVSVPVGLLACQRDPLLREITTTVISATVSQAPTPSSNGRKSKKEKAAPAPSEPLIEVILHDTVIFPEGGGQPSDVGLLTSSDGDVWSVVEAKRHGGHAVHYVRSKDQSADAALRAFMPGTRVGVALGDEGWKRRLDHTCMHTSQHLLSAVLDSRNIPTLSWSVTAWPTPCYVEIPRNMSADELASVQDEANRLVFEDRSVYVEVEELHGANTSDQAKLENGRAVNQVLPADYTGGVKRTVIIEGVRPQPIVKERQMEFDVETDPETMYDLFGDDYECFAEGPVWVYVLERRRAVEVWATLMGHPDPAVAREETPNALRALYGTSVLQNAVMGSPDSPTAEFQISAIFASSPPFPTTDLPDVGSAGLTSGSVRSMSSSVLSALRRTGSSGDSGKSPFKARKLPATHAAPDIVPRMSRAASLRAGIPVEKTSGPRGPISKERLAQTFENVPGHKRSSTITVASTAPPTVAPRMTRRRAPPRPSPA